MDIQGRKRRFRLTPAQGRELTPDEVQQFSDFLRCHYGSGENSPTVCAAESEPLPENSFDIEFKELNGGPTQQLVTELDVLAAKKGYVFHDVTSYAPAGI